MGNGTKAKRLNQPEVLLPMSALGLQQGGYCSQSVEFTGKPKESKKAPWMCCLPRDVALREASSLSSE